MVRLSKKETDKLELTSIRKCSDECYFFKNGGEGCPYFKNNKVKFGETCMYDMLQLKRYSDAFATGDLEGVKEDASQITGMVMMQIRRMLEQVNIEGVTLDEPILDAKGSPVWIPDMEQPVNQETGRRPMMVAMRKKDHPLIARCIQLAGRIGVDLREFKLTPKSAEEKRAVAGHIIADNPEDIKVVMAERRITEERWIAAVRRGTDRTKEDPVYKKLLKEGEIIDQ